MRAGRPGHPFRRRLLRRIGVNLRVLGRALLTPGTCGFSKVLFGCGLLYQLPFIDPTPGRAFPSACLDNATVLLCACALAWIAVPRREFERWRDAGLLSDHAAVRDFLERNAHRILHRMRTLRWQTRMGAVTLLGTMLCRPVVRLVLGRPARPPERRAFGRGLRQHHVVLPPLMRALVAIPDARRVLSKTMLASWLLADETYRGQLRQELDSQDTVHGPDRLRIWTGRPISFLHVEKTAGTSLFAVVASRFHPEQIDPDPWRASAPHLVTPFTPNAVDAIRHRPLVWGHYDLPSLRRLDPRRFVFTLLRSPPDRIVSLYYYWRSVDPAFLGGPDDNPQVRIAHRLGLLDFLRSSDPMIVNFIDNVYVRRLLGLYADHGGDPLRQQDAVLDRALAALASIDFVGISERTGESARRLGLALGLHDTPPAPLLNHNAGIPALPEFRPVPREPVTAAVAAELDRLTLLDRVLYRMAERRLEPVPGGAGGA